jgi:hypothetical protein
MVMREFAGIALLRMPEPSVTIDEPICVDWKHG